MGKGGCVQVRRDLRELNSMLKVKDSKGVSPPALHLIGRGCLDRSE